MSEPISRDEFAQQLDYVFRVELPAGDPVGLVLRDVSVLVKSPGQETFTLTFLGPAAQLLPQGIYTLSHELLGEQEIFIVPIARDRQGISYEAVFNRLVV